MINTLLHVQSSRLIILLLFLFCGCMQNSNSIQDLAVGRWGYFVESSESPFVCNLTILDIRSDFTFSDKRVYINLDDDSLVSVETIKGVWKLYNKEIGFYYTDNDAAGFTLDSSLISGDVWNIPGSESPLIRMRRRKISSAE